MDKQGLEKKSLIYSKAVDFSVRAVKCYQYLCEKKKEYVMSKQFLRSSTSIGANVAEANGAVSRADFRNKLAIAYKECLETKYWLELLKRTDYLAPNFYESIYQDAEEIGAMLFKSLETIDKKINK